MNEHSFTPAPKDAFIVMITFEPTEEQLLMQQTVADWARQKVRPAARAHEAARAPSSDLLASFGELGLSSLVLPESVGGLGASFRTIALVEEELAWGDAGVAWALPGAGSFAHAIIALGNDEQRARRLAPFAEDPSRTGAVAFSEARAHAERPGFVTTARRDGDDWVLSGTKSFVLHAGAAHSYVVLAQSDAEKGWNGIDAFVVDASAAGVSFGKRYPTLGLDAATFGEVTFANVRVQERDRLAGGDVVKGLLKFFARQSLHVAARAVGLSRASWELSRAFAEERKAFGKPISHFQAIAFLLSDRLIDIDGARGLVWRAAWALDRATDEKSERIAQMHVAQAVAEANEVAMRMGDDGVQIHGGAGFVRDYLVEKLMRDAKQLALCAPSATTADQLFAALALGAPLDPALVLPVPEIQPIFT